MAELSTPGRASTFGTSPWVAGSRNFPATSKAVRHAFDYALDKETVMNNLYGGPPDSNSSSRIRPGGRQLLGLRARSGPLPL